MREQLERHDDIKMVVYGFITHHLRRNYLRKSWLEIIDNLRGRRNPFFILEDGNLRFQGLADKDLHGIDDGAFLGLSQGVWDVFIGVHG